MNKKMADGNYPRALMPTDFAPSAPEEQRREPRYPHVRKIDIMPTARSGGQVFTPVELIDCSRHGLGLFASVPLEAGEEFLVQLRAQKLVLLLYTVRYCLTVAGGYHIGAELTDLAPGPCPDDPLKILEMLLEAETGLEPGTQD